MLPCICLCNMMYFSIDDGGWLNKATVQYFTEYADACYKAFGDKVYNFQCENKHIKLVF